MIKALITMDGERVAILGLSGENMARLMADEPILIDLIELGLPSQKVLIVGGKDEDTIAAHITAVHAAARRAP